MEIISIISSFKNLVYIIFYIYFFIKDIRKRVASKYDFIVFGIFGIVFVLLEYFILRFDNIINILYSICFGILVFLFSYISKESIGFGDSIFFIISGIYLSLEENVILFLTGLFFASIYGTYRYIRYKGKLYKSYGDVNVPFIPCLLPMILWRVVCIL